MPRNKVNAKTRRHNLPVSIPYIFAYRKRSTILNTIIKYPSNVTRSSPPGCQRRSVMSKNDDRETGPISVTLTTDYSLAHESSLTSQLLNDYEVVNRGQVNPGSLELEKEPERLFTGNSLSSTVSV